jgi:hypothetical protein
LPRGARASVGHFEDWIAGSYLVMEINEYQFFFVLCCPVLVDACGLIFFQPYFRGYRCFRMNSVREEGKREKETECEWVHWFELANGRSQWRAFEVTEASSIHSGNFLTVRGPLQERSYTTLVTRCASHTYKMF